MAIDALRALVHVPRMARPQTHPASLANLRPQSGNVHGSGIGSGKHTICGGKRKDGQACRAIAAYGTRFCVRHGARRAAGMGERVPGTSDAIRLMCQGVPRELGRMDVFRNARTVIERAALIRAWQAREQGDWGPWRTIVRT